MDYLTEVAGFATDFPSADLPEDAVERTKLIMADCIGAIAGGSAEAEPTALAARLATGGASSVIGTGLTAPPGQAALLNGTAGTWLEMDEGNQFCRGHPGIHAFPAALAFAEAHGASGRHLIAAVAISYEIGARIGIAASLRPTMHPHGTWGSVAAAVAVQRLAGADADRMREAINTASNLGLATSRRTMLEGGTVRNLFAGVSGQMGVLVNDLLDSGVCGEINGISQVFGKVVSEEFDEAAMTDGLGSRWEVLRNYFKMHACCRYNHAALDALEMIQAKAATPLDPDQIDRIEVESYWLAAELSDQRPRNVLAGKFSVPFALATTIVNGSSRVGSFTIEKVTDEAIRALAARVTVREDPTMSAALPDLRPARVTVTMTDGSALTAETETNRGDFEDPYPVEEIREKYLSLTTRQWSKQKAGEVWDAVMGLDVENSIAGLSGLIRAEA